MNRLDGAAGVARDVALVAAGRYGQYAVTLITLPLCARLLGPAGMGLLAVGMSGYFLGALCTDLGLTPFVAARVPGAVDSVSLARLRGDYAGLRGATLALAAVVFAVAVLGPVPRVVEIAALGLLVGSASACGDDWVLLGAQRFGAVVLQQAAGRLVYLLLLIAALPRFRAPETAMLCLLAGSTLAVIWSWVRTVRDYGPPSAPRPPSDLLRTGGPVFAARLLSATYGPGAASLFAPALSTRSLGLFSAGDRTVQAVGALLDAVGLSLLPRLARRTDDGFWTAARRGVVLVALGGSACAAATTALAPWLVPMIFGPSFTGAIGLMQVQAWALPGLAVASFIATAVLPVRGDSRGVLLAAATGAAVILTALVVALGTRSALTAVIGIVAAQSCAAIFSVARVRRLEAIA
ncbi:lipopolysaccharide biosynthesis protein [Tsukamurella serpentis]